MAGIAIGYLTVWGYKKLGGNPRKLNLPVLIVATLLGIALGVVLGELPALFEQAGAGAFDLFFRLMGDAAYRTEIIDSLVMGSMMSAIGLFLAYRTHTRRPAMTVTDLGETED